MTADFDNDAGAGEPQDALQVGGRLSIPLREIELKAVRASGAGGQNVNKVASAVHLRYDYARSAALPDEVRARIAALDDSRVTAGGIVIKAREHRTQARNRDAALERLRALIESVLEAPVSRVATRTPRHVKRARVEDKRRRGAVKRTRGPVADD